MALRYRRSVSEHNAKGTYSTAGYTIVTQLKVYLFLKLISRKYFLKNTRCYAIIFFAAFAVNFVSAQAVIQGLVTDRHHAPVTNASVSIKNSADGTLTDSTGHFLFSTKATGSRILVFSSVGFLDFEKTVSPEDTAQINVVMQNEGKQLDPVMVSVGSFEASDKAKGASLTPMDAVTVAGNGGDIANALRSLPGAQQVGDREGLFVRGGTNYEAKQFVDGTLLKNPNYGSVPGILQPARLNPFLFKGILFNTGGYSALYGEALSSALILESVDLPDKSSASLHIFPMADGVGFQNLSANNKSSFGINANYGSYVLYDQIVKQRPDFFHDPEYIETDVNFRIKTSKTGILKFYTNYGYNHTGMRNPDVDSGTLLSAFDTKGTNIYANLSYREFIGHKWKIDAAVAYNYNKNTETTELQDALHQPVIVTYPPFNEKNNSTNIISNFAQARVVFSKGFRHNQALRFGAEHFYENDDCHHNYLPQMLRDNLTAAFAEGDIYISRTVAAKIGLRSEYSSLLDRASIAPRLSLACRLADGGQFNFAYGVFFQKPEINYLVENSNVGYTQANHYIINYQKKANNRLLRIEAYYKKYNALVTTTAGINTNGDGYARGIELFFRDKRTFKNFDYWISYTYLDTKRKYLNYPFQLQPDYATPHTASIAIKRFFSGINLSANLSYTLATGRPYYNIQTDANGKSSLLDRGTTNMYNQMNLSFAYLFTMFKKWKSKDFSGIGLGINNFFGTTQIYGYNYNYDGSLKMPVMQPADRGFYIGLFMTFGIDRRDYFINENL